MTTQQCPDCGGDIGEFGPLPEYVCKGCNREFSASEYGALKL